LPVRSASRGIISDAEKAIIAVHEGGHAVVQRILPKCDPVAKVTIISRGMASATRWPSRLEDRYLQSKTEFEDKIAGLLGGQRRGAPGVRRHDDRGQQRHREGDRSRPADGHRVRDERQARPASRSGKRDELVFLGREIGEQRNYSDEVAKQIDEEVRAIIDNAYERAMDVLVTHRDKLNALAEKLVAEETVDFGRLRGPLLRPAPKRNSRENTTDGRRPQPADAGRPARTEPRPGLIRGRAHQPPTRPRTDGPGSFDSAPDRPFATSPATIRA